MPPQIGDFISQHVYGGQLKSNPSHVVDPSATACRFVDVDGCEQLSDDGKRPFVSVALVMEWAILTASCAIFRTRKKSEQLCSLLGTSKTWANPIGLLPRTMQSEMSSSAHSRTKTLTGTTSASTWIPSRVILSS